jgi:hypothetical protein
MYKTILLFALCFGISAMTSAQPRTIAVSDSFTTHVLFDYDIVSVDRGGAQLLAQPLPGARNILQLKAAWHMMPCTNVSAVTADGRFHSFLVHYDAHPSLLTIRMSDATKTSLTKLPLAADRFDSTMRKICTSKFRLYNSVISYGVRMRVNRLCMDSMATYLGVSFKSYTPFPFYPAWWRFSIEPRKKFKRTAMQDKNIEPYYNRCCLQQYIIALPPIALRRSQQLTIHTGDASGTRLLTLRIPWKKFIHLKK